jgi:hypothetical protein
LYFLLSDGEYFSREKFEEECYDLTNIHNDSRFAVFKPIFEKTMVENPHERYSDIQVLKEEFENSIKNFYK